MKRWQKIGVGVIGVALIAGIYYRVNSAGKAQTEALNAQVESQKNRKPLELTAQDVVIVKSQELNLQLSVSGQIKAFNSAFVKASVAGEVRDLSVREGDFVKVGQILAHIDDTEVKARLHQAQQQAESAKGQVDIAKRNFNNNQSLVDQGFISKTALDTSLSSLNSAEANYQAALAAVDLSNKSLKDTVIRSPISGQISQRLVQDGERVSIDARLLEVVDLSRLEMEASINPTDSLKIRNGMTAQLSIENDAQKFGAKLVRINPSAVAGSRAVMIYLALDNARGLRQGLFAKGELTLGKVRGLVLPVDVIRTEKPTPYVQIVDKGVVVHKDVTLGERGTVDGENLVIVKGVSDGARVLVGNVGVLDDGTSVTDTDKGAK